jgi:predicted double-glycine peptidase
MSIDLNTYGTFGPFDWAELTGNDWFGTGPLTSFPPPAYRDNYKRGEALPFYLDENQLKRLRDKSRILCSQNEFAICAIDNLKHYCVGTGFKYEAKSIDTDSPDRELEKRVNEFLCLFQEANDLPEREAEASNRCDVDGECFIRLFEDPDEPGMSLLRFVEPELIKTPHGEFQSVDSFGVKNKPGDVETVQGYWVIEDPISQYTPGLVPETDIVHIKLNTRSTAKRGVPTLYPIELNLKRAESLLANMTAMAKARAAVAMIRHMNGTNRSNAEALTQSKTEVSATDPTTGAAINIERWRPATVITAPKNVEYEFPNMGAGAAEFVAVLQADLRAAAARLNMPEWMFTADASNSNYSSAFVSESACVKMFMQRQDLYARKWGFGRYGQRKSVVWRAIERAIDAGILPLEVKEKIKVVVVTPSLLARDGDREASMNKVYADMKVKSRATIQKEIGLDPKEEDEAIRNDEMRKEMEEAALAAASPIQGKEPIQTGQAQAKLAVARNYGQAESVLDIRQDDGISCGAACSMAVARFFEVGPDTLAEWKTMLGTEDLGYTPPGAIVQNLQALGLFVEAATMDTESLLRRVREGTPVICPIQSDGSGHYVVVVGESLGKLLIHDPECGNRSIPINEWDQNWFDSSDGKEYLRYGVSVRKANLPF